MREHLIFFKGQVTVIAFVIMSEFCPVAVSREIITEDQPKTASEALLSFVKKERLCDVTFTFETSSERIQAHQLCLRSRSPVYDSMFRGRGSVSEMVELKLEDVKLNVFQKFLEFIYSDMLDATRLEALHLHQLGQKYKVQPLIEKCETLLGDRIPLENAVEMYEIADKYRFLDVKTKAEDLIVRSLKPLLQDPQLLAAKEATLIELLKRDDLRVKEVDLSRFVVRWGQEIATDRDHLPQVLAHILPLMRFTNMAPKEFTTIVMPTKLIPADEALEIFSYYKGDRRTRATLMSTFKFNISCRCGKLNEMFSFYEANPTNEHYEPLWHQETMPLGECISFKVRGVTAMSRTCPRFIYKPQPIIQLKSIQGQWPSLASNQVGQQRQVHILIFKKTWRDEEFQQILYSAFEHQSTGFVTELPMEPPVEIFDEAEYCIAAFDELCYSNTFAPTYRYYSDSSPCGVDPKSRISGGCLTNLEIRKLKRNDCPMVVGPNAGYDGIHVIRGMRLELNHNNPTT